MIRGPQKLLRVEAILREASRRTPAALWISVLGIEYDPFVVLGVGLVVGGRSDIVWASAPKRFLRRRGWEVSKRKPLTVCFPLETLYAGATEEVEKQLEAGSQPSVGVESVIVNLNTGVQMRQRLHSIAHEPPPRRWFQMF
jgi:hypothetical protein